MLTIGEPMATLAKNMGHLVNEYAVAEMMDISVATVRRWRLFGQGPKYLKLARLSVTSQRTSPHGWNAAHPAERLLKRNSNKEGQPIWAVSF
jgi:hypothetical protein